MHKFPFLLLVFASCTSNEQPNNKVTNDTAVIKSADTFVATKRPPLFNNQLPFIIKITGNKIEKSTTDEDTAKCRNWTLTEKNIGQIIKSSKPINGTQWDFDFEVLACSVQGVIMQNNVEYPFTINAAAYSLINSGDTTVIYGDYNKQDKKLFLSFPQP